MNKFSLKRQVCLVLLLCLFPLMGYAQNVGFETFQGSKKLQAERNPLVTSSSTSNLDSGCLDGQFPAWTFTPTCMTGEPESVVVNNSWPGEFSVIELAAGVDYTFSSSVTTDYVTISDEDGTTVLAAGTTPLTWTSSADQNVRFYLHLDENCSYEEVVRSKYVYCNLLPPPSDGCLSAPYGQWPMETYVPLCVGVDEIILDEGAAAGEYSMVQVTAGTEYVFSGSIATDFLTIGNEDGDEVLAFGTGAVTWTADADRLVRFYTHVNNMCAASFYGRSRYVRCGEVPPPPSGCEDFHVLSNGSNDGLLFEGNNQHLAVDIPVGEQNILLDGVEPTVIGEATNFSFTFYNDNNGLPGTEFATRTGTIIGQEVTGSIGVDFIKYSVKFDSQLELAANTTYWMEISSNAIAWEINYNNLYQLGLPVVYSNDNSSEQWATDGYGDLVFNFICADLAVSDANDAKFSYYPNPVKEVLNLSSVEQIKHVSIYNLSGEKVMEKHTIKNGQIQMSNLPAGVYVIKASLKNGKTETFKIVKQ